DLLANGYSFYGAYGAANQNFIWFQNGQCTGAFKWFDSYVNQIWLNNQLQLAALTLMQNAKSIPYDAAGNSLIQAALADPTAADAVITLSQPILFPVPQRLQGFSADDVTDIEPAKVLEHAMGVDGVLSFGFVWAERMQTIRLQADSASNSFFDVVNASQEAA